MDTKKTFWIHDFNLFITVILLTIEILVLVRLPRLYLLNGYYNILVLQEYLSLLGAEDPKSNKINILNHLIIKDTIIIADNKQIHGDIDTGTSYPIPIHYHFWNNPGWNTV